LSKPVKNLIKKVIESAIISKNRKTANRIFQEGFETFSKMSPEDISLRKNINNYEKYNNLINDKKEFAKGTPNHVKAAINYNNLIEKLKITDRYPAINSGEKIKVMYCLKNALNYANIAFTNEFPKEFSSYLKPDYRTMFDKNVTPVISRVFSTVGWPIPIVGSEQIVDLNELFSWKNIYMVISIVTNHECRKKIS